MLLAAECEPAVWRGSVHNQRELLPPDETPLRLADGVPLQRAYESRHARATVDLGRVLEPDQLPPLRPARHVRQEGRTQFSFGLSEETGVRVEATVPPISGSIAARPAAQRCAPGGRDYRGRCGKSKGAVKKQAPVFG